MSASIYAPAVPRVRAPRPGGTVLTIVGTRPEVIKMAPVLLAMQEGGQPIGSVLCAVGQQQKILDDALGEWGLVPDHHIDIDLGDRRLGTTMGAIVHAVQDRIELVKPDFVLVQGDTTTSLAASMAAFYAGIPIGHVEAGLRSGELSHPFPEEMHRILADRLASVHYVPTPAARQNLLDEGFSPSTIRVVGNTVVDALYHMQARVRASRPSRPVTQRRRMLLVTTHRRESFGQGMWDISIAIRRLVEARDDLDVVYVMHPHPAAREASRQLLSELLRVTLVEPQGYQDFVRLMDECHIVLTDSGGIQEEAPYLGKPVLVTRTVTERPESAAMGLARIVGTDVEAICASVNELLDDDVAYLRMARITQPFGDGRAAQRISADVGARLMVPVAV